MKTRFYRLDVTVADGLVTARRPHSLGELVRYGGRRRVLGPLAGARAQIILDGPVSSRVHAVVTFADGSTRSLRLPGGAVAREARAEAALFNALASRRS